MKKWGFSEAVDYLFASYRQRHRLTQHKFDREFRRPDVLAGLARGLGVLPDPFTTCLISGSKGKGTTSRLLAWNLSNNGAQVGLILTPEERRHTDRIRLNGEPIGENEFADTVWALKPRLDAIMAQAPEGFYLSPTGLFLLVGLVWFRKCGVDHWVIEGGRGVAYDEIGQIDARFGILTNILGEHIHRLGPTLDDIARDKLALCKRTETVWTIPQVVELGERSRCCSRGSHLEAVEPSAGADGIYPVWYRQLEALAREAFRGFKPAGVWRQYSTPAFQFIHGGLSKGRLLPGSVCCDGAIHPDCLDMRFLRDSGLLRGLVLIGLSDDKAAPAMVAELRRNDCVSLAAVRLTSPVGHICSEWLDISDVPVLASLNVVQGGEQRLREMVLGLAERYGSVYAVGNQIFIRSLRQAFGIQASVAKEVQ